MKLRNIVIVSAAAGLAPAAVNLLFRAAGATG